MRTAAQAATAARKRLKALARPVGEFDASRYFRAAAGLGFYNVGTSAVRAMARTLDEDTRAEWPVSEAARFADLMIRDRILEVKALGLELLARRRREFGPWLVPVCKRWLSGNHSANWATTDAMCGMVLGPALISEQRLLAREMPQWARHSNLWVRRAAVVALLPSIRRGLAVDLGYRVAALLHSDDEDLIEKAVGWMLRELGRQDRPRLEWYLRAKGPRIPRTTVRYALEHFPPSKRRALLAATKMAAKPGRVKDAGSVGGR